MYDCTYQYLYTVQQESWDYIIAESHPTTYTHSITTFSQVATVYTVPCYSTILTRDLQLKQCTIQLLNVHTFIGFLKILYALYGPYNMCAPRGLPWRVLIRILI